jgi:hypothetical protein
VKYSEKHTAEIITQTWTIPPEGKKWTLVLLAEEMKERDGFETINKESIRPILKSKGKLSRTVLRRGKRVIALSYSTTSIYSCLAA